MILRLVCCFIISLFSLLEADIVSTKGQIRFDVLGDGEAEMILNTKWVRCRDYSYDQSSGTGGPDCF